VFLCDVPASLHQNHFKFEYVPMSKSLPLWICTHLHNTDMTDFKNKFWYYNKFIPSQNKSVIVHVCFVLFIVCLYICVCKCLLQNNNHRTKHKNNATSRQHSYVHGPLRECRSIRSGASGLPYYCAPLVCVSDVIDSLGVWWNNKPKTKNITRIYPTNTW